MNDTGSTFRRDCAAAALVAAPLLLALSSALAPSFDGDQTTRLAAMDGTGPTISALSFLLAQLPIIVTFLGLGHLLRRRSPRLSAWGVCLGVGGAFAHAVFGGTSLLEEAMAADGPHRAVYAQLLDLISNGPIMLFGLLGLVGTTIGTLLVSIGLWRARIGPRWVPPVLWAFLVVEFALTNVTHYAAYLSPVLLLTAFTALAVEIHAQPPAQWDSGRAAAETAPTRTAV